ncbi:MAG: SlyX protein [Desulfuromonas sp.]|nr:MAG: SlyX protein [Desulfuromonas sp.]
MNEFEQRLTELEIRYTYQLNQLEELNEELTRANERIDGLQREVSRLSGMLAELGPELVESPDE